jgi:hypothetical protein
MKEPEISYEEPKRRDQNTDDRKQATWLYKYEQKLINRKRFSCILFNKKASAAACRR